MPSPKPARRSPPNPAGTHADPWQQPPAGVSDLALAWHDAVMTTYRITDMDGVLTLHTLMRAFDRAERAARLIEKHGELITGRDGQLKTNPACAVERDARAQMMQALKHLDIGIGPPTARPGRPMGRG